MQFTGTKLLLLRQTQPGTPASIYIHGKLYIELYSQYMVMYIAFHDILPLAP